MTYLGLEVSNNIAEAALAHGGKLRLKLLCVSVAVLDTGDHVVFLRRQDGASMLRPQIAIGKVPGALALGVSSRKVAEMAAERSTFMVTHAPLATSGIVAAAGGIIIVDCNGSVLGAVGATGDTSDNDELCALAGVAAVWLSVLS
jgi:uncharacterized protein GlcG (DUF336 family)